METVLVTGGRGLVGRAVEGAAAGALKHEFVYVTSQDGDLRDLQATRKIFEKVKPTKVVHLAARVGGLFANMEDQIGFYRDNHAINDNVISLCHEFKIQRAVFCLSTCVYPAEAPLPLTESVIHHGPPHPSNEGYAMAKRMMECVVRFYREKYGYEWVCVIPTNLYGPHDNFNLKDSHVIPGLLHKCLLSEKSGDPFVVAGTGKPMRQFLFARDAGRAIVAILTAPSDKLVFSSVILAADAEEEYSILELVNNLVGAMGFKGQVTFDTTKGDGIFKKTASNATLRNFLGPEFRFTPLSEGLGETSKWFRDNFETCRR